MTVEIEPLEVYSRDSNYAIIKSPGRNFPGCVIQGDSLAILCRAAQLIALAVETGHTDDQDFRDTVEDLNNALVGRIMHYQEVLAEHGMSLPYSVPFTEEDVVRWTVDDDDTEN
jgi:hypothetical protein